MSMPQAEESLNCWDGRLLRILGSDHWLVVAALAVAVAGLLFGERIPVNDGLGYDGTCYADLARSFPERVLRREISSYRVTRILPSVLIHYALLVLHVPASNANIVWAFGVLNVLAIAATAWWWRQTARELDVSLPGKWFGFAGLFLNFAVLKMASYYPTLTDMAAYALGAGMLHGYLTRRTGLLAIVTLLAAVTFPPAFAAGLLLLIFPRETGDASAVRRMPYHLNVVPGLVAAAYVSLSVGRLALNGQDRFVLGQHLMMRLLPLSLAIVLTYLVGGTSTVLDLGESFTLPAVVRRLRAGRVLLVLGLLLAQHAFVARYSTPTPISTSLVLHRMTWSSVAAPGIFLVAHAVYFGPIFLALLWLWRPVCVLLGRYGPGLALVTALAVGLSLFSESRCLIDFVPMLVPFVAKATDALAWRPSRYWLFAGSSLFFSKIWLVLNAGFPQRYFLNIGPWMTPTTYAVQGAVVLATAVALYRSCQVPWVAGQVRLASGREASARPVRRAS